MFPLSKKPRKDLDRRSKRQLARNTKCHILNSAPAVSSFSGENGLAKILGQFCRSPYYSVQGRDSLVVEVSRENASLRGSEISFTLLKGFFNLTG